MPSIVIKLSSLLSCKTLNYTLFFKRISSFSLSFNIFNSEPENILTSFLNFRDFKHEFCQRLYSYNKKCVIDIP